MLAIECATASDHHRTGRDVMKVADLVHRPEPSNDPPHQNGGPARLGSSETSPQTDSCGSQTHKLPPEHMDMDSPEIIHYPHPFPVQSGDWVIRLREGDPSTMPLQDKTDTWDGPFQILEGPKNGCVQLRFPAESKANRLTDTQRLRLVHPVPKMPLRGIFHPEKGKSIFVDKIDFKFKGKKARTTFIVDRLRGRRVLPGGDIEYLVHWAGWPSEDDTWESGGGLPASVLEDYEKVNPPAVHSRRTMPTPERKRRSQSKGSNQGGAAATRVTSSEGETVTSPLPEPPQTKRRRAATARAPAVPPSSRATASSSARFESYKEGRRRTRNSGFIEDLGV